jgi:uncharacterized protein
VSPVFGLAFGFLSGLVFGVGLILAGMTQPLKIKGFLDVAGAWDPSLALVMAGAIAVGALAFARGRHRKRAWSGEPMDITDNRVIDKRLVVGGLLFGVGWGVSGYCPGPAVVALGALGQGSGSAAIFVAAMLVGMAVHDGFFIAR